MSDMYVECLVKAKSSVLGRFFKVFFIIMAAIMVFFTLLGFGIVFVVGVLCGVAAYFINLYTEIEYEYLYLDRELVIDKVLAKTKRKRVATYNLDRIEVMAPVYSYHLDGFKNRQVKVKDYSIGYEEQPDKRYAIYYEGGEKLILSPSEDMVKIMKNTSPRKIFMD